MEVEEYDGRTNSYFGIKRRNYKRKRKRGTG
jgi:hypothetical protein